MIKHVILAVSMLASVVLAEVYYMDLNELVNNRNGQYDIFDINDTIVVEKLYQDGQIIRNDWQEENTEQVCIVKKGRRKYEVAKFYKNGASAFYSIENGKASGRQETYYSSGTLDERNTFVNGVKDGPFVSFYESGEKMLSGTYKNDEWHGLVTHYYESGKVRAKMNFRKGKLHGLTTYYWPNGKIAAKITYESGADYESECFSSSGNRELFCSVNEFFRQLDDDE